MKLRNYGAQYGPNSIMFKEEIDAITSLAKSVLNQFSPDSRGSFVLIGQKDDESPGESNGGHIVGFDFGYDEKWPQSESSSWTTVCSVVEQQKPRSFQQGGLIDCARVDGEDEEFLVLKTTAGRFLCSVCMTGFPYCETEVFVAVAKAIATMSQEDKVLQASYQELLAVEAACFPDLYQLDRQLEKTFERCREAKLHAWKEWHEATGRQSLFFQ